MHALHVPYYKNGCSRIRKDRQIKISLQEETLRKVGLSSLENKWQGGGEDVRKICKIVNGGKKARMERKSSFTVTYCFLKERSKRHLMKLLEGNFIIKGNTFSYNTKFDYGAHGHRMLWMPEIQMRKKWLNKLMLEVYQGQLKKITWMTYQV